MKLTEHMLEATDRATDVYHDYITGKTCKFNIAINDARKLFSVTYKGTDKAIWHKPKTWKDWFRNFNLSSVDKYKKHAWDASEEVYTHIINNGMYKYFKKYTKSIQGHSQGGPEAGTFYEKFCTPDDSCFMFDPPPYRKGKIIMGENVYIIVNDKSIVRHLGFITFDLPICNWWYFDAHGKLHTDLNWKEMRQVSRKNKGSITELWSDHSMQVFQKLIHKL
jgi:hypothetical protein